MSPATASQTIEALRSYTIESFATANKEFVQDLNALSEENLGRSWNGSRSAYDIAYEIGLLNQRFAVVCREQNPGSWPWEFGKEWLQAPDEFRNRDAIVKHVEEAGQELLDSIGTDVVRVVSFQGSSGVTSRPIYQLVIAAAKHTFYHDAQLNFMQVMSGDMAVHWT